ncbi:MAG: methionine--tRNA ligase subunit beta, partial [Firmicutes bacterium]|nr:methionine--tRNA ligase subunit beta [Bacillota bacterium]
LILIDRYGLDAVRYYLLREIPFGADGYYTEEALVLRINTDLANDLGNLLHRTVSMIEKFAGGCLPAPAGYEPLDLELQAAAAESLAALEEHMARLEIGDALAAVFRLVGKANKYIDEAAPWRLAKRPEDRERLGSVLYTMAEVLRIAAIALTPFLVETPGKIWGQLGLDGDPAKAWHERAWGRLRPGIRIRKGDPIFPRIETKAETGEGTGEEARPKAEPEAEPREEITIEEFGRIDLRVARVLSAERVEGTKKLLRLTVSLRGGERQIVAGIAEHYAPESLVGREIVVVANLRPARLRGLLSEGMLLAAANDEGGLALVVPERPIGEGSKVR